MPPQTPKQNPPEDAREGNHNKPLFFAALIICLTIIIFVGWYGYDQELQSARDATDAQIIAETTPITTTSSKVSSSTIDTSDWKITGGDSLGFKMLVPNLAKVSSVYNPLTQPNGDFYVENSTKDLPDYFTLLLSKESDFGLDDSWKEESINIDGVSHTSLVQRGEIYNRILISFPGCVDGSTQKCNKIIGLANKGQGWDLLLKTLETFKKL